MRVPADCTEMNTSPGWDVIWCMAAGCIVYEVSYTHGDTHTHAHPSKVEPEANCMRVCVSMEWSCHSNSTWTRRRRARWVWKRDLFPSLWLNLNEAEGGRIRAERERRGGAKFRQSGKTGWPTRSAGPCSINDSCGGLGQRESLKGGDET